MLRKISAAVQVMVVVSVIAFGTYQLYKGNFEASMTTLPFLVVYYLFVTSWRKRIGEREKHDNENSGGKGSR
jgi:hypothetical protein